MIKSILSLFDSNAKHIRRLQPIVEQVNALEPEMQARSDEELRALTEDFRRRIAAATEGARRNLEERRQALEAEEDRELRQELSLEVDRAEEQLRKAEEDALREILPEAFAAVRESSRRHIGLRHFDVQIMGGVVLHEGKIAEMKTGEGKTLVATLPLYLNALLGYGAHLVTVNDYLARRDAEWMGPIYEGLGLTVGVIQHDMTSEERRAAYQCDVTYITNHEIGFDYLRDNYSVMSVEQLVLRDLHYAIVDEVDSILIDEARVPLIISGPSEKSPETYYKVDRIVAQLQRGTENKETKETTGDYVVDEKAKSATLTEEGQRKVERMLGITNLNDPANLVLNHHVQAALKARSVYRRDIDYVVKDGEVIIVDEFTGRLMPGRRWSDGLHQAIEAKENVPIERESQTLATITYQNFFRMYRKLAGMTGTAKTEEAEFAEIYGLEVVVIPTHMPMIREDYPDIVYKTEEQKFRGIVNDILSCYVRQQPVLVGSRSIEVSERLSARLLPQELQSQMLLLILQDYLITHRKELEKAKVQEWRAVINAPLTELRLGRIQRVAREMGVNPDILAPENLERLELLLGIEDRPRLVQALREGIPHNVLNAKYHEQEAAIVAQAGRKGAVTISTNMAGRGTDILLGGNPEFLARSVADPAADPEKYRAALEQFKAQCQAEHEEVVALGGLHIIGSERHESRRIDNQLRGRSGRQGDPGSSRFYVSLQDELMRLFGPERWGALMNAWPEEEAVEARLTSRAIENAQKKVEGYHYEIRKNTLKYDDVMNVQRERIYGERRRVLQGANLRDTFLEMIEQTVRDALEEEREWMEKTPDDALRHAREILEQPVSETLRPEEEGMAMEAEWTLKTIGDLIAELVEESPGRRSRIRWERVLSPIERVVDPHYIDMDRVRAEIDTAATRLGELPGEVVEGIQMLLEESILDPRQQALAEIYTRLNRIWPLERYLSPYDLEGLEYEELEELLTSKAVQAYLDREEEIGPENARDLERYAMLMAIDQRWIDHLDAMDHLREGIHLRAYGKVSDPLIAYRQEGYELFQTMLRHIREDVIEMFFRAELTAEPRPVRRQRGGEERTGDLPSLEQLRWIEAAQEAAARGESLGQRQEAPEVKARPVRQEQRVGRNDPCPCGSGKKYKKCCMQKELVK